jgi:hypothetical protein
MVTLLKAGARAGRPPVSPPVSALPVSPARAAVRSQFERRAPPVQRDRSLALAESLQALRAPGVLAAPTAMLDDVGLLLCVVRPQRGVVTSALGVVALAADLRQRFDQAERANASHVTLRPTSEHSLDALCWHLGHDLAVDHGLLPWLRRLDGYRLISWPDFGAIGDDAAGRQLASRIVDRTLTSRALHAQAPARAVAGFLNACALCGLLVGASAPKAHREATAASWGGWWSSLAHQWWGVATRTPGGSAE